MLHKDAIRESHFLKLAEARGDSVSLYLPTTPLTQDAQADRIALKNLAKDALAQAERAFDKRAVRAMQAHIDDLLDDDDFWAHQAHGLAVLLTPERVRTYRLAYPVEPVAEVADRFHVKPLLPALRPTSAWVLGLSQKAVTLYEFTPAQTLHEVAVPGLPKDFSDATGRTLQRDRAPARRLEGDEGHKVLQTQFVRAVEKAVRPVVEHTQVPLVLASTRELQAMYRSLNHYDLLADEGVDGSVENQPVDELRAAVLPVVQALRQQRVDRWVERYHQRENEQRVSTDMATIARLATQGQVESLLVDADHVQHGQVGPQGELSLAERRGADSYDVLDDIVVRVLRAGGEVLAVRLNENAPEALMPLAATLRWA